MTGAMAVGATDAGASVIGSDSSADVGFSPGDGVMGIAGRYMCGHTLRRRFAVEYDGAPVWWGRW